MKINPNWINLTCASCIKFEPCKEIYPDAKITDNACKFIETEKLSPEKFWKRLLDSSKKVN